MCTDDGHQWRRFIMSLADALPPAPNEDKIPVLEEPDRITPEEADSMTGCVFDEANHGHYIGRSVVELALNRGWHDEDEATIRDLADRYEMSWSDDSYPFEVWNDIVDDAEEWLNTVIAPDGYSYGFHEGSFFFQHDYWFCEGEIGGYCDDPGHPHFAEAEANRRW
jgi:hypothetical protein